MKLIQYATVLALMGAMCLSAFTTTGSVAAMPLQRGADVVRAELDDFGYTYRISPAEWLEAGDAIDMDRFQRVALGFPFKFYDRTYTVIDILADSNVSTSAFLSFKQADLGSSNFIKLNFLGPFKSLYGQVSTKLGGTAPNRYLLVQWLNATLASCLRGSCSHSAPFDAQIIIQEGGDIRVHYRGASAAENVLSVQLSDWTGMDNVLFNLPRPDASVVGLQIFCPPPQARVVGAPQFQSQLTSANATNTFTFTVQNRGDVLSNTYEVQLSSLWPMGVFASAGPPAGPPLTDTNGNGTLDTGPILQGEVSTYTARLMAPAGVSSGTWTVATVTLSSAQEITRQTTLTLQAAVPAPFAASIMHSLRLPDYQTSNRPSVSIFDPAGRWLTEFDQPPTLPEALSASQEPLEIAELPSGGYILAKAVGTERGNEIAYVITNNRGEVIFPARYLSLSHLPTRDDTAYGLQPDTLKLAAAPSGRIGISILAAAGFGTVPIFSVLDQSGQVVLPPTVLGDTSVYGNRSQVGLAVTADSRFAVVWHEATPLNESLLIGTIRDDAGTILQKERILLMDSQPGVYSASTFKLAAAGKHVFVAYEFQGTPNIRYLIFDSRGRVTTPPTILYTDEALNAPSRLGQLQVVGISEDQAGVIWLESRGESTDLRAAAPERSLRFAVVDAAGTSAISPGVLATLDANSDLNSGINLMGIPDAAGQVSVLWRAPRVVTPNYRVDLNYVLVDHTGRVVTPQTVVESQDFKVGFSQYRMATHRVAAAPGTNLSVQVPAWLGVSPGELVRIPVRVTNSSLTAATDVVLTATLGAGATYVSGLSELSPTITLSQGQTVLVWHLSAVSLLSEQLFPLIVRSPIAGYGTQVSAQFEIHSQTLEAQPLDNSSQLQLWVSRLIYLPIVS